MTKYKCGHERTCVILDSNPLSYVAYEEWKDSVGWNGTKELCWECWCKEDGERKNNG